MKVFFGHGKVGLQDTQGNKGGFMVIYSDQCRYSQSDSVGHDELLEELALQNHWNKEEVHFGGIRLYFTYGDGDVFLSGVREEDNRELEKDLRFYGKVIQKALG